MCGISLIVSKQNLPESAIYSMINTLDHRGPDEKGAKKVGDCYLAQARLSIIDLHTGSQPMSYNNENFWITFNGEIYNYREIREELIKSGFVFTTHSDTEVILAAYQKWGVECLQKFRGMYAFCIWNVHTKTLFAARDLFGEKPLYYAVSPENQLIIASEIKAILASGLIEGQVDLGAIDAYLSFGYIPPDRTVYKNINTLPPAHFLIWSEDTLRIQSYWEPRFDTQKISMADASEKLKFLTAQAVSRQMVADVPVGAFLSGGLDSSTIVAMMQMQARVPVKTFSVGFGKYINELKYAKAVARKYGTDHYEIDLGTPDVAGALQQMAGIYDEPFADTSNIPTYFLTKFARQHVKVALSGDGADELFGGYSWSYPALVKSMETSDSSLIWIVSRLLSKAIRHRSSSLQLYSAANGLSARHSDFTDRQVLQSVFLRQNRRRKLWGSTCEAISLYKPGAFYYPAKEYDTKDANSGFYFDLKSYLPGDILVKVDRAAMANSLETRAPFLDRDVVEFALSLPINLKIQRWETKLVMQKAFAHLWPDEIKGRKKQGFGAPVDQWLKSQETKLMKAEIFKKGSRLSDLLPGMTTIKNFTPHEEWILLVLGLWLEKNKIRI